mgnify:CR=1 FL=1
MNKHQLSEDDFKVEGHCCAISIPAVRTATQPIDFDAQQLQDYFSTHYPQHTSDTEKPSESPSLSDS